jgi:putative spermidine/putrescine transport system permease protein
VNSVPRPAVRHVLLGIFTVLVCVAIIAPLATVILISFSNQPDLTFPPPGFSLRWFHHLIYGTQLLGSVWFSVWLGAVSSLVAVIIGLLAAFGLTRSVVPGRAGVRVALFSPIVVPKIALGVGLFILFAKLHIYGSNIGLVFAHALISLPFVVALCAAAMATTDVSLEEASRDLGASALTTFVRVLLPQIRMTVVVSYLIAFIISYDQLESTIFLVTPGHQTLPIAMYYYEELYQDPTTGALSTISVGVSLLLVVLVALSLRRSMALRAMTVMNRGSERSR